MTSSELNERYNRAAPAWGDKMRLLGYHDAYLGFLASQPERLPEGQQVLDVGCGTGAFADAWSAIHGPEHGITLLDPSRKMLDQADVNLTRRGVSPALAAATLDSYAPPVPHDAVLAAHVIEHVPEPGHALATMRSVCKPGGRLWLVVSKPHWCNVIIWFQWRHRSFSPEAVRKLLSSSGWQLEAEYPFPSGPPSRTSRGYLATAV